MIAVLFAQSAWAFEGHAGHFEGNGPHSEAPASNETGGDQPQAASTHCAHSPVHFMAVPGASFTLAATPLADELPPYRGPITSRHAEPPTQPPRS